MNMIEAVKKYVPDAMTKNPEITDDISYIEAFMNKHHIHFPEEYMVPFTNHICVLIERMQNNACTHEGLEEGADFEISSEAIQYSEQMLDPLFQKYEIQRSESEIKLMAIYLVIAINAEKGGEQNE